MQRMLQKLHGIIIHTQNGVTRFWHGAEEILLS
jgi:hypothetical protein